MHMHRLTSLLICASIQAVTLVISLGLHTTVFPSQDSFKGSEMPMSA
jgi:hypothetical protein